MFHDPETAGHPGELGTFNAVQQHFWWPGLRTFVKNYVQGCGICQQFKIDRTPTNQLIFLPRGRNRRSRLLIVQWILSLTFQE